MSMKHNMWGGSQFGVKAFEKSIFWGSKTFDPQLLFGEQPPTLFLKKNTKAPTRKRFPPNSYPWWTNGWFPKSEVQPIHQRGENMQRLWQPRSDVPTNKFGKKIACPPGVSLHNVTIKRNNRGKQT